MLSKIRAKNIKKVLWFLAIIIIIAFGLEGLAWISKRTQKSAATIYDRRITTEEFYNYLRNLKVFFLLSFGRDFVERIKPQELSTLAWQNLLLMEKAKQENMEATDKDLADKIKSFFFLSLGGGFSKERYLTILENAGLTPGQFEKFLREQIKVEKLRDKILKDIEVTDEGLKNEYAKEKEEAKIKYILVSFEKIKEGINLEEEQLKKFFEENQETFRVPAKVKIAYIFLKEPEPELIVKITKEIKNKRTLDEIAKEFSQTLVSSDLFAKDEPIKGLGWQKNITAVAFETAAGMVSGPIDIPEGVVFLEKIEQKDSHIPEFSSVVEDVRGMLKEEEAYRQAKESAKEIILAIKDKNITDLAKVKSLFPDLELAQTPYFKRQGYIENIGLEITFNEKVFSLKKDEILPEPIELRKGFYIIQLVDLKSVNEEEFEKEKFSYRLELLQKKRELALNAYMLKIMQESKFTVTQEE